ncbi:helix-turn-helix domain-containing protein [Streptomyces sp. NPDC021356]|uniref:ArsR/SmtB family transcription factor n=1 Tax=Streptomyces sp. NPDC021356 TaxID=3154900 RepID=UPI0033FB1784
MFSARDVAQVRFAVSPMWQVGASVRLLASGAVDPLHGRWLEQVRPRVAAAGLDKGWLAELFPPTGYAPDFLNPAPTGPAPTLTEELSAVVAAPADRVRKDLDHLGHHQGGIGPRLRSLHADPRTQLPRIAKEIETYWELALAPYWARIRTVLEADVLHRARRVSHYGAGHVLDELHPRLSWNDDVLRLIRWPRSLSRESAGAGLLLVPSAFKGPGLSTRVAPPDPPQLAYRARGTGTLWVRRTVTSSAATIAVLGRARTLLLTELETPATTTELAQRTGMSRAGVSQNLTALRDAGFVTAHRAGRSVLYARTSVAESVLAAG